MGSAQFWFDNWTEMGALYFQVPVVFGIDEDIHNVNDLVENDTPFWMLETRGHFTVKSAWDYLRRRANPKLAYKMIWVKGLPFKISFFLWKVWKAKLPLDDFLHKLGYFMPSKCWCCADPKEESLLHLFFRSNAATSVIHYASSGPTKKARTTRASQVARLTDNDGAVHTSTEYDKVLWEFPSRGWIKVNTDVACRGNPGRSSIGFCIRDKVGDLIYAEGREIFEGTNNVSEAVAIAEALKMCKSINYFQIWLQTYSMLLKNIIRESWKPPWYITEHVKEILRLKEQSIIKVTHIFIEGNTLADHLANYALDEGNTECHGFWDLDSKGRRIINEDRCNVLI
ncbi:uncharacterized protein LOC142181833 [Nicotiana tabacum]|uniref:Uncharacterized protein LOC142181833 n=1 Tax=Nicotiana tabacum TaxID=4097 RepID=A0AC58UPT8_TOBAC